MDTITWDESAIKSYFDECTNRYEGYYTRITELEQAFRTFINDETHTGDEADSARQYVRDVQIPMLNEMARAIRLLQTKQGDLLSNFNMEVDAASDTIDEEAKLTSVIKDFSSYLSSFKTVSAEIKTAALALNSTCTLGGMFHFAVPHSSMSVNAFEKMTDENGSSGLVPKHKKNFINYDEAHKNDVDDNSEFGILVKMIRTNIARINKAADGADLATVIKDYSHNTLLQEQIIKPEDVLNEEQMKDYEEYVDKLDKYLRGEGTRCSVFGSDPVNMTEGNYIAHKMDIRIGGAYPLEFARFYNAMSEHKGIFGRGWTHSFDQHLTFEEKENRTVSVTVHRYDGSEHLYRMDKEGNISPELHGEKGTLKKFGNSFVITFQNGTKEKYGKDGWLKEMSAPAGGGVKIKRDPEHPERILEASTLFGATLKFSYDENGMLTKVEDHTGREVSYKYSDGELSEVCGLSGSVRRISYDDAKRVAELSRDEKAPVLRNRYAEDGRIIEQHYADGNMVTFNYDDEKKETVYTEQNGNVIRYVRDEKRRHIATIYSDGEEYFGYDDRNNRISYTDKRGFTTRYTYDNAGRVTSITNPLGERTTVTYDATGRPFSLKKPDGRKWKFVHDKNGCLLERTDPKGNVTRFEYDLLGECTAVFYPDGTEKRMTYTKGNLTCVTLQNGEKEYIEYDSLNRPVKKTDEKGNFVTRTYDDDDRVVSETDARGFTVRIFYDAAGHITEKLYQDGTSEKWDYDPMGRIIRSVDREGKTIERGLDVKGNVIRVDKSDGVGVSYERDLLSRVIRTVTDDKHVMMYAYDPNGNQIGVSTDGVVRVNKYDPLNRVIASRDASGNITETVYNADGQIVEKRRNGEVYIIYEYDENGNKTLEWSAKSGTEKWEYDCMNRVIRNEKAGESVISYEYDSMGHVSKITDPNGKITEYVNDAEGHVLEITDELDNHTKYEYDPCGELTAIMRIGNGETQTTRYTRDIQGRVTGIIDAEGNSVSCVLDAKGRIAEETDSKGRVTRFSYDENDRPESVIYHDDREVRFEYDGEKLSKISDWTGETQFNYTEPGKVEIAYPDGNTVGLRFNSSDRTKTVTYPDGREVVYKYDNMKRLEKILCGEQEISYKYDGAGKVSDKCGNDGVSTKYLYDEKGRLSRLTHSDEAGVLDEFVYKYDKKGNCITVEKNRRDEPQDSGVFNYEYDALGRVSEVRNSDTLIRKYEYDPFGNRKRLIKYNADGEEQIVDYSYNLLNQLVKKSACGESEEYRYDDRGNLTEVVQNGELKRSFSYDSANMLSSIVEDGHECHYEYNGLRQRVSGQDENGCTTYVPDLIENRNRPLIKKTENEAFSFVWNGGDLVSEINSGEDERYFRCLSDRSGSIVREVDNAGETIEKLGYDEFGNEIGTEKTGHRSTFGYACYMRDGAGDVVIAGIRAYIPSAARFLSKDPVAGVTVKPDSQNPYVYCFNSPLNWKDPTGRTPNPVTAALNDLEEDFNNALEEGKKVVDDAGKAVSDGLNDAGDYLEDQWTDFKKAVSPAVDELKKETDELIDGGKKVIDKAGKEITEELNAAGEYWEDQWTDFKETVSPVVDELKNETDELIEDGKKVIDDAKKEISEELDAAGDYLSGKKAELDEELQKLGKEIEQGWNETCEKANELKIELEKELAQLQKDIEQGWNDTVDWSKQAVKDMNEELKKEWDDLKSWGNFLIGNAHKIIWGRTDSVVKTTLPDGSEFEVTTSIQGSNTFVKKYNLDGSVTNSISMKANCTDPFIDNTKYTVSWKDGDPNSLKVSIMDNKKWDMKMDGLGQADKMEINGITYYDGVTTSVGIEYGADGLKYVLKYSGDISKIPDDLKPYVKIEAGSSWSVTKTWDNHPDDWLSQFEMAVETKKAQMIYDAVYGELTGQGLVQLPEGITLPGNIEIPEGALRATEYGLAIVIVAVLFMAIYCPEAAFVCA